VAGGGCWVGGGELGWLRVAASLFRARSLQPVRFLFAAVWRDVARNCTMYIVQRTYAMTN